MQEPMAEAPEPQPAESGATPRKRPKPGERRIQILQALAAMLEKPGAERVTTAALAAQLQVSEAALYRHFASKAQMFEGLIDFIEQSVFTLINQVAEREGDGAVKAGRIVALQKFLDHIARHDRVWVCKRIDIARHWKQVHPYPEAGA